MTESTAPADDVWTVRRILQWTTGYLQQKQFESPRLEAELLLAHARKCQRINLYTDLETPLTDSERADMRDFVKRRAQHEPLAYITGQKEFYGRNFHVGQGVLVPRPETETLIDVCLDRIPNAQPIRIAEVGFGSGCIAITLARQRPRLTVLASDISPVAMSFAERNVQQHKVENQVQLLAGDGYEPIRHVCSEPLDGIVSNPPYIREDEMAGLDPDVLRHEPHEALVSGADGLDLVRRLIQQAGDLLSPKGWIAMELDPAQCPVVATLLEQSGFTPAIHNDLNRQPRVVSGQRGSE
ncbi:MAG: peptide chain release factor N(5)-glutamine methyltransferase [Planctomycetaceae bacterium]